MSEENVEIIRRLFEAVASRDSATVLDFYDPDAEIDGSRVAWGDLTEGGIYYGHEGLRSLYRHWYDAWENYEEELEELIDAGDAVVSVVTGRGRGRASGALVENAHHAGIWTIQNGKVIRVVWFPSRHEAVEAAGLPE